MYSSRQGLEGRQAGRQVGEEKHFSFMWYGMAWHGIGEFHGHEWNVHL